ncbi:hypothetical protein DID88_008108 [Monilinia fructigena]|uniref:Uncharacterized protein n=1 Tax=Monilinia fructigena TaxID=38457 RepID=A0A395J4D6_9HELO|nr:hypothetical protein DID88_008108 [Monilinia fructigena]
MERVLWIGRRLEMGRREERNRIVLGEGWRSLLIRDEGGNVVDAAAERRREEQEESDGDDGIDQDARSKATSKDDKAHSSMTYQSKSHQISKKKETIFYHLSPIHHVRDGSRIPYYPGQMKGNEGKRSQLKERQTVYYELSIATSLQVWYERGGLDEGLRKAPKQPIT